MDAVLDPLLDKVEQAMRTSLQLSWTSLELDELYSLLKSGAASEVALDKCGRAVHRLLALMLAVQMTAVASKVRWAQVARWPHAYCCAGRALLALQVSRSGTLCDGPACDPASAAHCSCQQEAALAEGISPDAGSWPALDAESMPSGIRTSVRGACLASHQGCS